MTDAVSIDKSITPTELWPLISKKTKTDDEKALLAPFKDASLSAGAKTYLGKLAKQFVYSYNKVVGTKYMDKGLAF